ncbi:MAG: glucose-6-phosphate isomerase, partial [Thermoanaerobaculia bacterium]
MTQEPLPAGRRLWERFRKYYCHCPAVDLGVDPSRMRFPEGFFRSMEGPIRRALEAMRALERGAIANPDEKRMVGHYWLRAPELAPSSEIAAAIRAALSRVKEFAAGVHAGEVRPQRAARFRRLLLVGIGGSALGPQLVADALG